MSVSLKTLEDHDFEPIEVMSDSYDKESLWFWLAESGDNRLDFSRSQLKQLRDYLDEIL